MSSYTSRLLNDDVDIELRGRRGETAQAVVAINITSNYVDRLSTFLLAVDQNNTFRPRVPDLLDFYP